MHSVTLCSVCATTDTQGERLVPSRGENRRYTVSPHYSMLSVAHPAFVIITSLPAPTNPAELLALRRRARRVLDTVSDLIRPWQHSYAPF